MSKKPDAPAKGSQENAPKGLTSRSEIVSYRKCVSMVAASVSDWNGRGLEYDSELSGVSLSNRAAATIMQSRYIGFES